MLPSVARSSVRRSPSARRASLAKATGIRTARLFPHLETCVSLGIRICNEMRWWLLITAIAAVVARAEEFSVPSQLYIVSVFLSPDVSAFHYRDRVVDVKPAGPDSLIRYSRVATVNLNCPRIIVQSATGRCTTRLPANWSRPIIPAQSNRARLTPCSRDTPGLRARLSLSPLVLSPSAALRPLSSGCRSQKRSTWTFCSGKIPSWPAFGTWLPRLPIRCLGRTDIFHGRTEADDLILQRDGEKLVPELVSGRYDAGLAAAFKRNAGTWRSPRFRSLLTSYRGPVSVAEASLNNAPQLLNAQACQFSHFVTPIYPPLAKALRIEGKVELQLSLEPATGEVLGVLATSGHPLLEPSAIDAAKRWRFKPESIDSKTLNLTLDFALRCR